MGGKLAELKPFLPETNLPLLQYLLRDCDSTAYHAIVARILTKEAVEPVSFPGRDEGGFIADPRLKDILKVEKAIDMVKDVGTREIVADERFSLWYEAKGRDDTIAQEIYPFRAKGDKAIRRTRFYDLISFYHSDPRTELLLRRLQGMDYIRALNTSHYLLGLKDWFGVDELLCDTTIEELDARAGKLSSILKASDCELGWQRFAELKCLTGYRLVPWKGFDPEKSTEELASGGIDHRMFYTFREWYERATAATTGTNPEYVDLRTWIERGQWLTSGSSSSGKLIVEFMGETFNVKCRKNFVKDVLTVDELYDKTQTGEQVATAFTKCELGKVRVAVCSDIGTYLLMSWFVAMTGSSYKNWKWVTRQEQGKQKRYRMLMTVLKCKLKMYGMAWDYEGFERQVKTMEMLDIIDGMGQRGLGLIPELAKEEWHRLTDMMVKTFENSWMITPDGKRIKVTGGLPSGLYLTSIVGDAIGISAAEAAIWMTVELGLSKLEDENVNIQGDDANYMHRRVAELQVIEIGRAHV